MYFLPPATMITSLDRQRDRPCCNGSLKTKLNFNSAKEEIKFKTNNISSNANVNRQTHTLGWFDFYEITLKNFCFHFLSKRIGFCMKLYAGKPTLENQRWICD